MARVDPSMLSRDELVQACTVAIDALDQIKETLIVDPHTISVYRALHLVFLAESNIAEICEFMSPTDEAAFRKEYTDRIDKIVERTDSVLDGLAKTVRRRGGF